MMYPCYEGRSSTDQESALGYKECVEDTPCPCGVATRAEKAVFLHVRFWLEAVALTAVGGVGLVCNFAAIPVLLSR